mmetsp:Transcript_25474/g.64096  ORF Transcript_25474/g.64096 Transcript_25474/m.64096 type:complete len:231 (-) Transcript_25474:1054-1746(-)
MRFTCSMLAKAAGIWPLFGTSLAPSWPAAPLRAYTRGLGCCAAGWRGLPAGGASGSSGTVRLTLRGSPGGASALCTLRDSVMWSLKKVVSRSSSVAVRPPLVESTSMLCESRSSRWLSPPLRPPPPGPATASHCACQRARQPPSGSRPWRGPQHRQRCERRVQCRRAVWPALRVLCASHSNMPLTCRLRAEMRSGRKRCAVSTSWLVARSTAPTQPMVVDARTANMMTIW